MNLTEGRKLRDDGIKRVAINNSEFVAKMQKQAIRLSRQRGEVHIDDLRAYAIKQGIQPDHKNAWGAIFNAKVWQKIGYRPSALPSNRGHVSPVWVYGGAV